MNKAGNGELRDMQGKGQNSTDTRTEQYDTILEESLLDIAICDFQFSNSSLESWNIKSSGKRSICRCVLPYYCNELNKSTIYDNLRQFLPSDTPVTL